MGPRPFMGAANQDLRCSFLHCEELAFDVMSWDSDLNKGRHSGFGCFQETRVSLCLG